MQLNTVRGGIALEGFLWPQELMQYFHIVPIWQLVAKPQFLLAV